MNQLEAQIFDLILLHMNCHLQMISKKWKKTKYNWGFKNNNG